MTITIRIPTTLRHLSAGISTVQVEGSTLAEVLTELSIMYPGFTDRLLDSGGNLHKFLNIFVDDDDVRYLQGLETGISTGQTVSIIPAVAGGAYSDRLWPRVPQPLHLRAF